MFGLFKRSKVEQWERELLINVFSSLPKEYSFIQKQVKDGLLKRVFIGSSIISNYIGFSYDPNISFKYEDKNGKYFRIIGITAFDQKSGKYIEVIFYISFGLINGYSVPNGLNHKINANRFDVSNFRVEMIGNSEFEEIVGLLTEDEIKIINENEVYEVELNKNLYYHIADLEDGDFIGIDQKKNVYRVTHDPFEIVTIKAALLDVLKNIDMYKNT